MTGGVCSGAACYESIPIRLAEAEMMKMMTEGREPVICENVLEVWSVAVDRKPEVVIISKVPSKLMSCSYSRAVKPCQ